MFRLPFLARHSAPGAVFDPFRSAKGGFVNYVMPLVPVLVHVGTIFVLNQIIYRSVAGVHPSATLNCNEHNCVRRVPIAKAGCLFLFGETHNRIQVAVQCGSGRHL